MANETKEESVIRPDDIYIGKGEDKDGRLIDLYLSPVIVGLAVSILENNLEEAAKK